MYLNLEQVKKHLNIDSDFTEDDDYLNHLILVAESAVSIHLNIALVELETGGTLPPAIIQAMLLMIGTLYSNRESVAYNNVMEVPLCYQYLIDLYRNYKEDNYG